MKKKVGTVIDEAVVKLAKRRAVDEGRPLSELIQDALLFYLSRSGPDPHHRDAAYRLFCQQPIRISGRQLNQVLEKDAWEL